MLKNEIENEDIGNDIGKEFGRYTVIAIGKRENGKRFLKCKCKCGVIKEVYKGNLTNGHIISCGCARRDNIKHLWLGKKRSKK